MTARPCGPGAAQATPGRWHCMTVQRCKPSTALPPARGRAVRAATRVPPAALMSSGARTWRCRTAAGCWAATRCQRLAPHAPPRRQRGAAGIGRTATVYVFALVAWVGGERHGLEKSHAFSRKVWQCTIRISRSGGGGTTGWAALVQAHGPQGASFNTAWQQGHGWCARCSMVACSRGRRRQRQRRRRGQAPPATTTGGAGAQSTGWPKCLLAGRGVGGMDRPPQRSSGWGGRRECGWGVGA